MWNTWYIENEVKLLTKGIVKPWNPVGKPSILVPYETEKIKQAKILLEYSFP
jgi:hypothetical protein